jgi:hypothetical protein
MGVSLKRLLGVAAFATLIIGSMLRGVEPWMLPQSLWRTEQWIWLAMASAGGFGFTVFMISLGSGRDRLRLAVLAMAISVSIAGGMRWVGGEFALNRFFNSEELHGTAAIRPDPFSERLVKWLEDKKIAVPAWLQTRATNHRAVADPPRMHRLVSYSRWPVRRKFVRRMMTDDTRALYLVENWDECFPAVTGADVDLDHRRELMEMFREFRTNPSLSKNSRQAATLWLGLVFLTDPMEFANWREPIRDAMLEIPEPIQAQHHDCWMRVLDTLLAYDPPASWPAATQALASHPTTLRRAVRERVRGVMSHFDAIVREFDASERSADWSGAFALWQDTGRWLAAYPGTAEEDRVRQWRRTKMFQWLTTDGLGTQWNRLFHNQEILVNLTNEDVVDFTAEQESVLYAKACDWADQAVSLSEKATATSGQDEAHVALEHVRVLHPFLSSAHRKNLIRRITPALVRPAIYTSCTNPKSKLPNFVTCLRCRRFIERSWHEISPEHLKSMARNLRPLLNPRGSGSWLLCFDAWSDTPEFSDEEWLLHAIAFDWTWRLMPPDTPKYLVEIIPYTRLPVPPAKDEVVRKVIADLKAAMVAGSGGLASLHPDHPLPTAVISNLLRIRDVYRKSAEPESPDFETLMRMELYLLGLIKADDGLLAALSRRAREDYHFHRALLQSQPDYPDLWSEVLKSPSEARRCLLDLIGLADDERLRSLLSSAVKSLPAYDGVLAMWQELRKLSDPAAYGNKPQIYGALFQLAPRVPVKEQLAMRRGFLEYFRKTPIPTNQWPDKVMYDIRQHRYFLHDSESIPWEDDSLSAALSWSSDVGRQVDQIPEDGVAENSTGVFSYLAQAMISYDYDGHARVWMNHEPVPQTVWKRQPLHPPFAPTPWQQARDLHLRRPDLRFPDPAWARPGRR